MLSFPRAIIVFRPLSLAVLFRRHALSAQPICCSLPPPPAPAATSTDPLGRTTPQSTVLGFLHAAQSGDYSIAAQYLQMTPAHRQSEGEQLASKLNVVLNRAFTGLRRLEQSARGNAAGRRPAWPPETRHHVGRRCGSRSRSGACVRSERGKIWLISSDTLTKLPELYDQVEARQVETSFPACWSNISSLACRYGSGWRCCSNCRWLRRRMAAAYVLEIPVRWWARRRGQCGNRQLALGLWPRRGCSRAL